MNLEVDIKKQLDHMLLEVSFVAEEEVFALLGPSGAGKSMTLKCIAGIETPDEGRIAFDGVVLYDSEKKINVPPQKRRVGYLFQDYALFPHLTVEQNLLIVNRDKATTYTLLKKLGIEELLKNYPDEISNGQKQRVALARMLAAQPRVLLLDEPFSALDCFVKEEVIAYTEQLIKEAGTVTLLVTHQFEEVGRLARQVACIREGKLEGRYSVEEFFALPKTRELVEQTARNLFLK